MINQADKISIVIPIYNAEKWIEQCVASIQAQTYKNLEIILINDGSIDNSEAICNQLAKTDHRIKVKSVANGGASYARNQGIDIATGTYIAFVDSDDTIDTDMYENMYIAISNANADMAVCGFKMLYSGYTRIERVPQEQHLTTDEIWDKYLGDFRTYYTIHAPVCNKLVKTDLLQIPKLRFPENMKTAEDTWFFIDCIQASKNGVCYIDTTPYNYYMHINPNSLTKSEDSAPNLDALIKHIENYMRISIPHKSNEIDQFVTCQASVNTAIAMHNAIINNTKPTKKLALSDLLIILKYSTNKYEKFSALLLYTMPYVIYKLAFKTYAKNQT